MFITQERYAAALNVAVTTASRRLRSTSYETHDRGTRWFHLGGAVQTLLRRDAGKEHALLKHAKDIRGADLYVGHEKLEIAQSFVDWTTGDYRTRARAAMNSFVVAVSNSRVCTPAIVRNLEPLRMLYVLNPDVIFWVLAGGTPPDTAIAPAFAVSNNSLGLDGYHTNLEAA